MISLFRRRPTETEALARLQDENRLLLRRIQARDDRIAVQEETIRVLRDALATLQSRANLETVLNKADTAQALAETRSRPL